MELAFFLIVGAGLARWFKHKSRNEPKLSDYVDWTVLFVTIFDNDPIRLKDPELAQEDPNSNPHYIWNEQDPTL